MAKNAYRPKLEALALELYRIRDEKREAETEDKEFSAKIKNLMKTSKIRKYDGKEVSLEVLTSFFHEVDLKTLIKYIPLEELAEAGILSAKYEELEAYISKEGKDIHPSKYIKKGKPYQSLRITLKK